MLPLRGALLLDIRIIRHVPMGFSEKYRQQALNGELWPVLRPDLGNYAKLIEDALNGEVYIDDAQICKSFEAKVYGPEPKTIITVQAL